MLYLKGNIYFFFIFTQRKIPNQIEYFGKLVLPNRYRARIDFEVIRVTQATDILLYNHLPTIFYWLCCLFSTLWEKKFTGFLPLPFALTTFLR